MSAPTVTRAGERGSLSKTGSEALRDKAFRWMLLFCILVGVGTLVTLLAYTVITAWPRLDLRIVTEMPSQVDPATAGAQSAITGTLWLMVMTALWAIPVGIASAIYLEEYANPDARINRIIEVNIANLAAVPSVVFGILGLAVFARLFGFGPSLLTGSLTLSLLVLPTVVIASRQAIRAVPRSVRMGSLALGATKWQTIWRVVLPSAVPGMATGTILALSFAIGEAAPLVMLGIGFVRFNPDGMLSSFTALPIQIYSWTTESRDEFRPLAAAGSVVLLMILLTMNSIAIYVRNKTQKRW